MAFPGACRALQNLIFDPGNAELLRARPGVGAPITTFAGFTTPTSISVHVAIGTTLYGMVASAHFVGFDEPFAYDTLTNTFIAITGVTGLNLPSSLSTGSEIVPPTMTMVGIKVILTHTGFSGVGANFVGALDLTNPAAPAWSSSQLATHGLPSVPTNVANFNNRAYYSCGNVLYYSDVLTPLVATNAGQSITIGDTTPLTALSGLPIQTSTAGVVSGLIVFKAYEIWQVTGDAAVTGSLALNFMALNVGCQSPRTVVQTPIGTVFIAIDGPYYVSAIGQVLPLTKDFNKLVQDVQLPFQGIKNPCRAAAAYTGSIYRVCLDSIVNGVFGTYDYWFDVTVRRWNGPHTFPYDCISSLAGDFIVSSRNLGAKLYASQYIPDNTSVYNDDGVALSAQLQTALLPKTQNINVKQVIESTIELAALSSNVTYQITAFDETFAQLGSVPILINASVAIWGDGSVWGGGSVWNSLTSNPKTYTIPWLTPLVFKKMAIQVDVQSSYNLVIGTAFFKYTDCGYTNF